MADIAVCPDPQKLTQLLHGAASEEEIDSFAQHLETCSTCAQRIEETDASSPMLKVMRQPAQTSPLVMDGRMQAMMDRLDKMASLPFDPQQTTATPCPKSHETQTSAEGNGNAGDDTEQDYLAWLEPAKDASELGRLGAYRILNILGIGGMGVVYQAEDTTLKRTVALKAMKPSLASNNSARQRFLREAQTAAAVRHDNVVTIYQAGEHNQIAFLAMEYLDGESLEDRLKRETRLTVAETLRIGREIAEGLAAAHAHDLIHRDIKPSNLWLEQGRGRVKILDFGLARAAVGNVKLTQSGTILGTPAYMAPEQAEGESVNARADLFSLGCVLYRMATGELPFKGEGVMQILRAIALTEPRKPSELNPEISSELSELIMKLLEKDPTKRIASAGEVVAALQSEQDKLKRIEDKTVAVKSDDQVTWRRAGDTSKTADFPSPSGRTRSKKSPILVALAFLFGLVVCAGGIYGIIRISTPEGDYVINTDDPDFSFSVSKGTVILNDKKAKREYRLKVVQQKGGEFELEVTDPINELSFNTKAFSIKRGEVVALKAWFERKPADVAMGSPVDDAWIKSVAAMPAEQQVKEVAAKLKARNPGFNGDVKHEIDGKTVTVLRFVSDHVTDLSPIKALPGLHGLFCGGGNQRLSRLADLSPLKGMRLYSLNCGWTKVSELMPLREMNTLRDFDCSQTEVRDLLPLKDIPLTNLNFGNTRVADLSPLKSMKLGILACNGTGVSNLAPITGMKLSYLDCHGTDVSDLSPLKGMVLEDLGIGETKVTDLSPLKDTQIAKLSCAVTKISDLAPLKHMKLTHLNFSRTDVTDLAPLKGMQLVELNCWGANYKSLAPLAGMPLKELSCNLDPRFVTERDVALLRSLKSLESINGKTVAEFLPTPIAPPRREQATGFGEGPAERPAWLPKEVEIVLGDHRLNTGEGAGQIIVDAEGKQFAMLVGKSAYIGSVRNLQAVKKLTTETTPKAAITRGSFSPDGKKVIAGFTDGTIVGWDVESGNRLFRFKAHDYCTNCLILPGGREFASTGVDGNVIVWDLATQTESFRLPNPTKGLKAGVLSAAIQGDLLLVGTWKGADPKIKPEIYVLNLKTKKEERRLKGHTDNVSDVVFSPDGKLAYSVGYDDVLKTWDLITGSEIGPGTKFSGSHVNRINFSPNGELLVFGNNNKGVSVVEVRTGREIWNLPVPVGPVRFLPDNRHVLVADGSAVRLIDAKEGKEKYPPAGHTGTVRAGTFLKDGARFVSSAYDERLLLWEIPTAKWTKQAKSEAAFQLVASPDGKVVIAGGAGGELDWWDTATLRNTQSEKYRSYLHRGQVSPDGSYFLVGDASGSVCVIDMKTGKEIHKHSFSVERHVLTNLAFHPIKKTQAILCFRGLNKLFLWDVKNLQEIKSWAAPTSAGGISPFGVSPDGRYCYTTDKDGGIHQIDLESAEGDVRPLAKWHASTPTLAVSPDGRFLGSCAADGRVILWELPSGSKIQEWNFHELPGCPVPFAPVHCIFSPDSRHLVTTNSNGTIYFFRLPETPKAAQK